MRAHCNKKNDVHLTGPIYWNMDRWKSLEPERKKYAALTAHFSPAPNGDSHRFVGTRKCEHNRLYFCALLFLKILQISCAISGDFFAGSSHTQTLTLTHAHKHCLLLCFFFRTAQCLLQFLFIWPGVAVAVDDERFFFCCSVLLDVLLWKIACVYIFVRKGKEQCRMN